MSFTPCDKRIAERKDLAFQEKHLKDTLRHTPDAAEKLEPQEIEHTPICLYQKKMGLIKAAQEPSDSSGEHQEG